MDDSDDLPLVWTQRIRSEESAEKFEDLQDELEDRNRKYGKSAVGEFALRLAHMKLQELEDVDQAVEKAANI